MAKIVDSIEYHGQRYRRNRENTFSGVWELIEQKGDDECWRWNGSVTFDINHIAHARYGVQNKRISPLRIIWMLTYASFPDKNTKICHTCGTKDFVCCNPKHLFECTSPNESRLASKKEGKGCKKYCYEIACEMRNKFKELIDQNILPYAALKQLCKEYHIQRTLLYRIIIEQRWGDEKWKEYHEKKKERDNNL